MRSFDVRYTVRDGVSIAYGVFGDGPCDVVLSQAACPIDLLRATDVAGIAVHIASRVAGLAAAGEIYVSRTVVDLTAGSGLTFEARGDHQLKGVPGEWSIFAAC